MTDPIRITRRALILGTAAVGTTLSASSLLRGSGVASAMGRFPLGGQITVAVPYDTSTLDPNSLYDPIAALISTSVFDTIFRYDSAGNAYASLALSLPERVANHAKVTLRDGLISARGLELTAHDLIASVNRARKLGASALLHAVGPAVIDKTNPRTVIFRHTAPAVLTRALASPLVPLMSLNSSVTSPDGTGAFAAIPSPQSMILQRNPRAARGPAFLRTIRIERAENMRSSLRAFEAHQSDIGWMGAGLYRPRKDAVAFDFGPAAWIVLRTGKRAGLWNAPGVAQQLVASIDPRRLAHLGLGLLGFRRNAQAPPRWTGPSCTLLSPNNSAHLVEIASTIASILSQSLHEVTPITVSASEFRSRRQSGDFAMMIDIVRPLGFGGFDTLISLTTADAPDRAAALAASPPRLNSFDPRMIARTLRLAVIGTLQIAGSHSPKLVLRRCEDSVDCMGWDLAQSYVRKRTR